MINPRYEKPEMIPVCEMTEEAARACGARPGSPNNPPQQHGMYILCRDKVPPKTFYLEPDRCLSREISMRCVA